MRKTANWLAAASLWIAGCGCSLEGVYSVSATVVDEATGEAICDAEVIFVDERGNRVVAGPNTPASVTNCSYLGPLESPGHFTVVASKDGFESDVRTNIEVQMGRCHVDGQSVSLRLRRRVPSTTVSPPSDASAGPDASG